MRSITTTAILYLAAPNLLFLLTWINPWIGLPAALVVAGCCAMLIRSYPNEESQPLARSTKIFVFCLALFWTTITGTGSYFPEFQGDDYIKHLLLFNDLVHRNWPVEYGTNGVTQSFICYSLGYYLVPAFAAKCIGENWLSLASFLWTFLGIYLFFWWVASFNRKLPIRTLILFLFFAGLGIIWFLLRNCGWRSELGPLGLNFNYPDWWTKVAFSPQHALAAWIGSALLYDSLWRRQNPRGTLFIWSLVLLWSPFTPLGLFLLPLLALQFLGIRNFIETTNLVGGGLLVLIMGFYYKAHMVIADQAWIWAHSNPMWPVLYILYACIQILIPASIVFLIDRKYNIIPKMRTLFIASTVIVVLLPIYKIGSYSDLRVQASGPLFIVVSLSAVACLTSEHFSLRKPLFAALAVVYLIGAVYPLTRPWYTLDMTNNDYSFAHMKEITGVADLSQFALSQQYLGNADSATYKYLLKH